MGLQKIKGEHIGKAFCKKNLDILYKFNYELAFWDCLLICKMEVIIIIPFSQSSFEN